MQANKPEKMPHTAVNYMHGIFEDSPASAAPLAFRGNFRFPDVDPEKLPEDLYRVVILDNDYNTYQQVMDICMKALGVTHEEAFRIALSVDNNGRAEVLHASYEEAQKTASIIREIGIEVVVEKIS